MTKKTALKRLVAMILALMAFTAAVVFVMDPFYQYHRPYFGMEAVLHDRDNQMPGTVRNFAYNSVLLGSSVMENCDHTYLDQNTGNTTLKIARASGSVADLLYYLDMAWENHELSQIYWCLDLPSLSSSSTPTLKRGGDAPWYLHTKNVMDDIPYVYNKEIIFQQIPYTFAAERKGKNIGGKAYYWADDKNFSADSVRRVYQKPKEALPEKDFTEDRKRLEENLALLKMQMEAHPDTEYIFFVPPFSMAWWDCAYVNGELQKNLYVMEETMKMLLTIDNATLYFFQGEEDIVCNLDIYMDMLHYNPQVNQYMLEMVIAGEGQVTEENIGETIEHMEVLVQDIIENRIYEYYPREGE